MERLLAQVASLGADEREALLYLLGRQGATLTISDVAAALSGSRSGAARARWPAALRQLVRRGLVVQAGSGRMARRPSLREWLRRELAPHRPSDEELDEALAVVLRRLAAAGPGTRGR
ncbi:MAG TPA: hypothetical protein VNL95_00765 [Dehalococcoidia bacterium]|nr:hypothetical protein [Dehalococcoidia bacterium]